MLLQQKQVYVKDFYLWLTDVQTFLESPVKWRWPEKTVLICFYILYDTNLRAVIFKKLYFICFVSFLAFSKKKASVYNPLCVHLLTTHKLCLCWCLSSSATLCTEGKPDTSINTWLCHLVALMLAETTFRSLVEHLVSFGSECFKLDLAQLKFKAREIWCTFSQCVSLMLFIPKSGK